MIKISEKRDILEVIEMIKEDPTSIRYLDKLSEEEYDEIYKYSST